MRYGSDFELLFFSLSYQMVYSLLWGVEVFLKTFPIIAIQPPRSSEFDSIRRIICFGKKNVGSVNFHFRAIIVDLWQIK